MATAPSIFYFNPTSEMAIANGTVSWQPNRMLARFEQDLELIVAFLANENDVALLREIPSKEHLLKLTNLGFKLPNLLQIDEALSDPVFIEKTKEQLSPWGWSPAVAHKLKPIYQNCLKQNPLATSTWSNNQKELFSRVTALDILQNITNSNNPDLISQESLPQVCKTTVELERAHKNNKLSIIKTPWSSSGRGLQIIDRPEIHPSILNWCKGALKEQGYLMIEPLLNKQLDFAFQFEIKKNNVIYCGSSWFTTNEKNGYKGNFLRKDLANIPKHFDQLLKKQESFIVEQLTTALKQTFCGKYEGMAGVDAMLVLTSNNQLQIHPCVEINLRYNMGNIADALSHFATKGFSSFEIGTTEQFRKNRATNKILLTEGKQFCAYMV